ncbi:hypothetical protein CDL15_Pgr004529 [Punica granatum]|uniref:Uncharacterized protein n=1 Tax=Punica granatum TaxID=22663 RepID=A0A218WS15_PUNGR|nr:hypothetical protein CDL15_Pgr004529 [Punica granatum]
MSSQLFINFKICHRFISANPTLPKPSTSILQNWKELRYFSASSIEARRLNASTTPFQSETPVCESKFACHSLPRLKHPISRALPRVVDYQVRVFNFKFREVILRLGFANSPPQLPQYSIF